MTQEQALLRAKQNEILARKNLALMLKKNPDDIEVETKLTDDITKPNNDHNYDIAKENRTEYKQIELAKQTATANKAIADAAYSLLPTVSLVGTYDFKNTNATSLFNPAAGAVDSSTKDWLVSLNAQWIILDGAKTKPAGY
jgi:outer membrane protein TolC